VNFVKNLGVSNQLRAGRPEAGQRNEASDEAFYILRNT